MKHIITKLPFLLAASVFIFGSDVFAYEDDKPKEYCRDPKFFNFSLPVYSSENKVEVAPESEFTFTLSNWTDPETITVTAKNIPLQLKIENKMSFYRVTSKLPAELNGNYARINVIARAVLGCRSGTGWLVKIASADKPEITKPDASVEEKSEALAVESEQGVKDSPE